MSPLTVEQLYAFHAKEREIFSKLVLIFSRPPAESLLIMATWFWFEDSGFENIFSTILDLQDPLVFILANEAVAYYRCIDDSIERPPNNLSPIPLTAQLMKRDMPLNVVYQKRYSAIVGIRNFLNTVCSRVFSDILQKILPSSSSFFHRPRAIPGFPDPTYGNINLMHDAVDWDNLPKNYFFCFANGLWRWNATCIATQNERTMFLTFSRGFPVSRDEVWQVFTREYGEECVEDIYIPKCGEQALWGRVVLDSVVRVDCVLNGMSVKKLEIYKKHIWARKYTERQYRCNK